MTDLPKATWRPLSIVPTVSEPASEIVERVARVLDPDAFRTDGGLPGEADRDMARDLARAAIAEMREPTGAIRTQLDELCETQCHHQSIDDGWRMLVDAALK